jgi:hypothetical protein
MISNQSVTYRCVLPFIAPTAATTAAKPQSCDMETKIVASWESGWS